MPEPGPPARRRPFLSIPTWDISDEEIRDWKQTPGRRFAAYTAECIRDGKYDRGQELYPPGSPVYQEITRETVDQAMELLAERGMAKRSGGAWHAVTPGRLEPSISRALAVLLAHRGELPPALADELDCWKATLESTNSQIAVEPSARQQRTTTAA